MGIPMFSAHASPIAIDFGSSSVKLLQIGAGDRPTIAAAAELPIPDHVRGRPDKLFAFWSQNLPNILSRGRFKGKRAVLAIPSAQTFIQHMQLGASENGSRDSVIKERLCNQMGCLPDSIVVRCIDVGDVQRNGQSQREVICFAIARDTVMRYVDLLAKCKLKTVGVHTETLAIVRAFDHLNGRDSDRETTTLFVDLGWSGAGVAVAHGRQVVFARYIQIGGRHFDELIASTLDCDAAAARMHRLSLDSPASSASADEAVAARPSGAANVSAAASPPSVADTRTDSVNPAAATQADRRTGAVPRELACRVPEGNPPHTAATVDLTELLDTIADELSMCLRYHQGLFPERSIDRAIFLGGEARQVWLCQHVVKAMRLPAQLGDPIARLTHDGAPETPGLDLNQPQPGWAVACGLCTAPTDL